MTTAVVSVLVLLNACLVAAEYAIVTTPRDRIAARIVKGGRRARSLLKILDDLEPHVSALRFTTVTLTLAIGWFAAPVALSGIARLAPWLGLGQIIGIRSLGFALAFGMTAAIVIVAGELAPRILGLHRAEPIALWAALPTRALVRFMRPLRKVLGRIAQLLVLPFGIRPGATTHDEGVEDLRLVISQLTGLGRLSAAKRQMFENLFHFSELTARQIMVPRDRIHALSMTRSLEENLALIRETNHTRYPLCERDLETIIGMVHIKDLFIISDGLDSSADLRKIRRKLPVIPESQPIEELQKRFERERVHMAVVIDEHGAPIGLVTLEDVLEELVGEIHDEFDAEESPSITQSDEGLLIDGMMLIDDLCRQLEVDLAETEADTVGGFVTESLGKIGKVGDRFRFGHYEGWVAEMEGRRVSRIHLSSSTTARGESVGSSDA